MVPQGFNVPSVDAGSLSLSLTDIDLSTIYSALHPENFSYCTPPQCGPHPPASKSKQTV